MLRVTKDILRQLNAAAGKFDVDTGRIFVGFVGRLEMADGLYYGELRHKDAGDDPPDDTISLQSILPPEGE